MPTSVSLPYQLRIGVTGHRNLPEELRPAIVTRVQETLSQIQQTLEQATAKPFSTAGSQRTPSRRLDAMLARIVRLVWREIPVAEEQIPAERRTSILWTVVSPLAKGADRIVARAVLALPTTRVGECEVQAKLHPFLPLLQVEYEKDFVEPEDLAEFHELLAKGTAPRTLHRDFAIQQHADTHSARNEAYYDVGRAVVESSEIILVIWNGKPAAGHGGTAEIVRYAVDAGRVVLWINSERPDEPAKLLQAKTEQKGNSESQFATGGIGDFACTPLPTRAKQLSPGFHRLSAYNRDPAYDAQRGLKKCADRITQHVTFAGQEPLAVAAATLVANRLTPLYVRADQLAAGYQRLHFLAGRWVYVFSVGAIAVAATQILLFPQQLWLIAFEILFLIAAGMLVRVARNERWKEKWLNDRHLAEWLRRHTFTLLLGRHYEEAHRAIVTARPYAGAESWYHNAFWPVVKSVRAELAEVPSISSLKQLVVQGWIASQAEWHDKNHKKREHKSHAIHRWSWAIFLATLLVALLHLAGVGHSDLHGDSHAEHDSSSLLSQLISLAAILLPAAGAAFHAIAALHDHDRIAARSSQLAPVLRGLADRAHAARDYGELAQVVLEADHIMAHENDDWWVSIGAQPPVIPG